MENIDLITKTKEDLSFMKEKVEKGGIEAVLLYGSYAENKQTARSDIDICIVAPKLKTPKQFSRLLSLVWQKIDANKYDVRVFEELPLYIKMEVIKKHIIIFSSNIPELYFYFYHYRKLWQDQSVNWVEAE